MNILNNFGLTNGLDNFFIRHHNVSLETQPGIMKVTVHQEINTPGIKTPLIKVKPNNRYQLSIVGYTSHDTKTFITISSEDKTL